MMMVGTVMALALGAASGMMPRPGFVAYPVPGDCGEVKLELLGDGAAPFWRTEEGALVCRDASRTFRFLDSAGVCAGEELTCETLAAGAGAGSRAPPLEALQPALPEAEGAPASYAQRQVAKLQAGLTSGGRRLRRQLRAGTVMRNLVLMIRFSDHGNVQLPPKEDYELLFNSETPNERVCPTGSVRGYFRGQSYGQLEVESVLTDWITVDVTEAESAGDCHGMCHETRLAQAIQQALGKLERDQPELLASIAADKELDMFSVIHSGFGAELGSSQPTADRWIWSHRYRWLRPWQSQDGISIQDFFIVSGRWGDSGSTIARMGVVVHEMAHYLGLPDLYDVDRSSLGVGRFDVMSDSWGKDKQQLHPGSFSAPLKYLLGWVQPRYLEGGAGAPDSTWTLGDVQGSGDVVVLPLNFDPASPTTEMLAKGECIVIEYRAKREWDALDDGGMLLWHLDFGTMLDSSGKMRWNANVDELKPYQRNTWPQSHAAVRLIQADRLFHLEFAENKMDEGDWWRTPEQVASDDTVAPNLQTYLLASQGVPAGHTLSAFSVATDGRSASFHYAFHRRTGRLEPPTPPRPGIFPFISVTTVVLLVVACVLLLISVVVLCVCLRRRRKRRQPMLKARQEPTQLASYDLGVPARDSQAFSI